MNNWVLVVRKALTNLLFASRRLWRSDCRLVQKSCSLDWRVIWFCHSLTRGFRFNRFLDLDCCFLRSEQSPLGKFWWVFSNPGFVHSLGLLIVLYIWFIAKSFAIFWYGLYSPIFTERVKRTLLTSFAFCLMEFWQNVRFGALSNFSRKIMVLHKNCMKHKAGSIRGLQLLWEKFFSEINTHRNEMGKL